MWHLGNITFSVTVFWSLSRSLSPFAQLGKSHVSSAILQNQKYIPRDKISSHFFINYWRRKERESCIIELGSTNRGRLAQEWDKQAWSSNITKWGFSTSTEGRIANLCTDPKIAKTYTCRNICVCAPWRFQNLLIRFQNLVKNLSLNSPWQCLKK